MGRWKLLRNARKKLIRVIIKVYRSIQKYTEVHKWKKVFVSEKRLKKYGVITVFLKNVIFRYVKVVQWSEQ